MKIKLHRWMEIDEGIADEVKALNDAGLVIEACRPQLNGTPANALIRPSSAERARGLGYEPEYQSDTGLFFIALIGKPGHDLQKLGLRLRLKRHARGLSQQEVAVRAGITRSHLTKIEKGVTDPSWRIVRRLENVLA